MIYRLAPFLILLSAIYFVVAGAEPADAEKKPVKQPKITNIVYFDIAHGEQKLGRSVSRHAARAQALSYDFSNSYYGSVRWDSPEDRGELPCASNGQEKGWHRARLWLQGLQIPPCYQGLHVRFMPPTSPLS
jgi:hypothetical protein